MNAHLVHQLLEASATEQAERIAVYDGERTLTYAELERQSNRVAHLLIDLGLSPGDRVGLYLDKSLEAIVGIYGALKAGGAYVPLDPHAPPARLGYIAGDCGLRFLLTGVERAPAWSTLFEGGASLEAAVVLNTATEPAAPPDVRVIPSAALESYPISAPAQPVVNLDLAYILYTSGSTGNPKGVMLSHLNALTFIEWAADLFAVGPQDRLSSHAPLHFDLSVFDLFAAAKGGAAVVLVPSRVSLFPLELATFIAESEISVWYSVPSALTALVLHGQLEATAFPRLRTVLFAGEVFPTKHLQRLTSLLPDARFYNLYGPTETNVCTYYEVARLPEDATAIPIGKAIEGVDVYPLDNDGKVVGVNDVGELCVRGPSVMQGYWGDPDRTTRAFNAPLPATGLLAPAYRTGDLVRRDEDGNYWYLGRKDSQVKSRGYRIELGEIEVALNSHPAVAECAVVAVPDEEITNRIVAFVALRSPLDEHELVRYCAKRLPGYMIPEAVESRSELPKTSTGKIDRQSLAASVLTSTQ